LEPGHRVNLERALRVGDRLGGHLGQGHGDGLATVRSVTSQGGALLLDLAVPPPVARVSIPPRPVTVNRGSPTGKRVPAPGIIQVSLIPHTRRHTTLGDLAVGDRVQVEGDVIGKYVGALTAPRTAGEWS